MDHGSPHHSGEAREALELRLATLHSLLTEFERVPSQKKALIDQHSHRYRPAQQDWGPGRYFLLAIILTIGLTVVAVLLGMLISYLLTFNSRADDSLSGSLLRVLPLLLPLPCALIAAGVILVRHNRTVPAANERIAQDNALVRAEIEREVAPQTRDLDTRLSRALEQYRCEGYPGWFPERYLTAKDVAACWQLVHDHRASSVQEVINVYRTELHQQFMQNAATAQLAEQERATRVAMLGNVINAAGHATTQATIRQEGAATRAAMPRTVRFEK